MTKRHLPAFLGPCLALLGSWFGGATWGQSGEPASQTMPDDVAQVFPLLQQYCGDCHSGDSANAGLAFERLELRHAATVDRHLWSKVLVQLDNRLMPPPDDQQPSDEDRQLIMDWIRDQALVLPCDGPAYPGRVTLRRLNRDQYNRTVRDLIGVDFRPADSFPSDDVGYGFDHIGDVLSLPPVLLERYLEAADEIVRRAIVAPDWEYAPRISLPGRFLASVGDAGGSVELTVSGEYIIQVQAYGDQAGPDPARMALIVDDRQVQEQDVRATDKDPGSYQFRTRLERGPHQVAARFLNDYYQPDHPDPALRGDRNLNVLGIQLIGPLDVLPDDLPESHRRLLVEQPPASASRQQQLDAVRANLRRLLPRALRRPSNTAELERYTQIGAMVLDDGLSFPRAMQVAVQAVLVSPHFLFRVESDPVEGMSERELDDYELASRLSYFLWSSLPDDALYRLAAAGRLNEPEILAQQIRRMLEDPRSMALVENFAGQWLQLRQLDTLSIDTRQFPLLTSEMRTAMRRETELLFEAVLKEHRGILELLTADFTFVDQRLAELYGIDQVSDTNFQRVQLQDNQRGGLLGHASILTVTSNPTRTSPVKRGKWILDNLLGTPPPPAPPNVPDLAEVPKDSDQPLSLRQQVELHRSNPQCAACHRLMDPLGFGLENFNAIGQWREADGRVTIDARGELPDGQAFDGPAELRQILLQRADDFRRCLTAKLLTYALGRGLEYFDQCTVETIATSMQARGDTLAVLIEEIVDSRPFRWQASTPLPPE